MLSCETRFEELNMNEQQGLEWPEFIQFIVDAVQGDPVARRESQRTAKKMRVKRRVLNIPINERMMDLHKHSGKL